MVLDLGRDYYKLDGPQLETLRNQVAAGDMEQVLKVYEKELQVGSGPVSHGHYLAYLQRVQSRTP